MAAAAAALILLAGSACSPAGGVLSGAGSSSGWADAEQEDREEKAGDGRRNGYSIDVILKTNSSEYWGYVQIGCLAYAKEHPEVHLTVKGASAETAEREQKSILWTDLQEDRYDAYVVAPLQQDGIIEILKDTERPVIALDTPIESDRVAAFCGTDHVHAAKAGVTEAVQMAKDRGWTEIRAVNIAGVPGSHVSEMRTLGFQQGVEEAGGIFLAEETVYADASAKKAAEAMRQIIENHPEGIALIACNNDDIAVAALGECLKEEAYRNTVILGFDGIGSACERMIENPNYANYVTVGQNPYEMGYKAVEAAVEALDGKLSGEETAEGRPFIDPGFQVITQENASERMEMLHRFWE